MVDGIGGGEPIKRVQETATGEIDITDKTSVFPTDPKLPETGGDPVTDPEKQAAMNAANPQNPANGI